jgi:hypothetical protein
MVLGQVWKIITQPDYLFDFMGPVIDKTQRIRKLHKLLTCSTCMAGQFALWIYPVRLAIQCAGWPHCFLDTYDPVLHLCIVAVAVWLTALTNKLFS